MSEDYKQKTIELQTQQEQFTKTLESLQDKINETKFAKTKVKCTKLKEEHTHQMFLLSDKDKMQQPETQKKHKEDSKLMAQAHDL